MPVFLLASLALSIPSPATADAAVAAADTHHATVQVAAADDEVDEEDNPNTFAPLRYYFSWTLDDELHPEVDDEVPVMWVLAAILPLAEFWLPYVMGDPGDGYFADTLSAFMVHNLGYVVLAPLWIIPPLGYAAFVVYFLALKVYFWPLSMLNHYSRSLYREDAGLDHPLTGFDNGPPPLRRSAPTPAAPAAPAAPVAPAPAVAPPPAAPAAPATPPPPAPEANGLAPDAAPQMF